jgi:hypothetical protein
LLADRDELEPVVGRKALVCVPQRDVKGAAIMLSYGGDKGVPLLRAGAPHRHRRAPSWKVSVLKGDFILTDANSARRKTRTAMK